MTGDLLDGRYRLDSKLRDDGPVAVWQAVDTRMDRPVSVRLVDEGRLTAEALETMRSVTSRLATVTHPNLVPVYDLQLEADPRYVVEAYLEGETASRQLRAGWRLAPGDVAEIAEQLASALAAVHRLGLHHGAVSPASVLIDTSRTAYLVGFGQAAPDPDYRAPGEDPPAAGDIYGLAATIFALLCGEAPREDPASALEKHAAEAPRALRKAVLAGLRPAEARPDAGALLALMQEEPFEIESVPLPMPTPVDLARTQVMPRLQEPVRQAPPPVVTAPPTQPDYAPRPAGVGAGAWITLLILAGIAGAVYVAVNNPFGGMRLPALAGKTEAEAKAVLDELGLEAAVVGRENSDTVTGGRILRSVPAAGERVRAGGQVQLTLSSGPRYVTVPSVKGLTPERANQVLLKAGLSVGTKETAHDRDAEDGVVVAQSPAAGQKADKGSLVTIHVNEKPKEPEGLVDRVVEGATEAVEEHLDEVGDRAGEAARGWLDEQRDNLKERTRELGREARERAVEGVRGALGGSNDPPDGE